MRKTEYKNIYAHQSIWITYQLLCKDGALSLQRFDESCQVLPRTALCKPTVGKTLKMAETNLDHMNGDSLGWS